MNVLFLTTHLNAGGIGSYIFSLTKALVKRGHKVFVASSGGNMQEAFTKEGATLLTLDIKTKSELNPKIYLALSPLAKFIKENRIDLIHAHTRISQVMGTILDRRLNVPLVTSCHGYFKTRLVRRIFPCWGRKVIAISDAVYKHLRDDFKIDASKIVLIESGINLQEFSMITGEERIAARRQLALETKPVIGMIARLSDVKGQDILIKAMPLILKEIPSVQLLIVGEGKTEDALKGFVQSLKLEEHVKFFPVVNKTRSMMAAFDIFVMPSRQEGLGLSIIEAQACGVAVVAAQVGGIVSLIKENETGLLFAAEDHQALAKQAIRLIKDKTLAEYVSKQARKLVEEKFSLDMMTDKVIDLYKSLL